MTTHNKHIHYDYYNTLAIRASPTKFQFSGKPNEPNVVFTNGQTTTHYTSKEISIVGSTLIIENEPITNYGKNLFLHFPLVSDPSVSYNAIDQMLGSKVGESLEILLAPILGQDTDCIYKAENIAVFPTPIRIQSPLSTTDVVIEGASCNDTNKLKADIDKLSNLIGAMRADTDSLLAIHKEGFVEGATSASKRTAGSSRGQIANIQSISDQVGDEAIKNAIKNAFAGAGGAGGATLECTPLNDKGVKQEGQYLAVPMNTNETATIFSIGLAYVIVIIMSTGCCALVLLQLIKKNGLQTKAKIISTVYGIIAATIGLICIIVGGVKKDIAVISIGGGMILTGIGSGFFIYNKFQSAVIAPED
jgi:hypothetical protein